MNCGEAGRFDYEYAGWAMGEAVTRGSLPHWYKPGFAHFFTYRLANSISQARLATWREEREAQLQREPPAGVSAAEHREQAHKRFFAKYDAWLDRGGGDAWLADPRVAAIVRENLYHHHASLYELIAYCVMPNHVHVFLQPFEEINVVDAARFEGKEKRKKVQGKVRVEAGRFGHVISDEVGDARSPLTRIMHALKSYTAHQINDVLGRGGQLWQHESYDHWARDEDEMRRSVEYIVFNPVKAGLCESPELWPWSSARDRYDRDGSTCGAVSWVRDDWLRVGSPT